MRPCSQPCDGGRSKTASSSSEGGTTFFENPDDMQGDRSCVTVTKDEITIGEATPDQVANHRAAMIFKSLKEDFSEADLKALTDQLATVPLSRERVQVILDQTQNKRVTCEIFLEILRLVALDSHKETILYERYAHLVNREEFDEKVLSKIKRSTSGQGIMKKKLVKSLTQEDEDIKFNLD